MYEGVVKRRDARSRVRQRQHLANVRRNPLLEILARRLTNNFDHKRRDDTSARDLIDLWSVPTPQRSLICKSKNFVIRARRRSEQVEEINEGGPMEPVSRKRGRERSLARLRVE